MEEIFYWNSGSSQWIPETVAVLWPLFNTGLTEHKNICLCLCLSLHPYLSLSLPISPCVCLVGVYMCVGVCVYE